MVGIKNVYFVAFKKGFIIFPSEQLKFNFSLPKSIVSFIKSNAIEEIALFFTSSENEKLSEIGILCAVKGYYIEDKKNKSFVSLKSMAKIKALDRNQFAGHLNGYVDYEIIEDDFTNCSRKNVDSCFMEIISQINNMKVEAARIAAAYMLLISQNPSPESVDENTINSLKSMLENPDESFIYQKILDDFCRNPTKIAAWIYDLFNKILAEELDKARWHVLNERDVMTQFEILVENLVPIICQNLDSKYLSLGDGSQALAPANQPTNENLEEIQEIERKIKNSKMPPRARETAQKQLRRLKQMRPENSDYHVCLGYLDTLTSLPWGIFTKDNLDIQHIQKVLDDDHYGLNDVKERIIEFLAVQKLNPEHKGTVLCFIGPPGTGKTSIAHSVGRAFGRKMIRISLGSMRDEAEIKGHRRIYVGATTGKIINEIIRAGSQNPIFILDEIDKLREDFKGDPASALLDIFDPEQNQFFVDNYLDVEFDLSRVFFITTGNTTNTIPPALLDRMDIIEFSSYTEEEKLEIAKRHLMPKQIEEHGLGEYGVKLTDEAIMNIICFYTRESGVRKLERKIKRILRKIAVSITKGEDVFKKSENIIECKDIRGFLGKQKFFNTELFKEGIPGVAIGLAWTESGGSLVYTEARETWRLADKFKVTGLPQEIIIQSVEDAVTYLNTNRRLLKIGNNHFDENMGIHVRFRYGAIPKDGPSAGITIVIAIYSELMKKPIRNNVAFTGEIMLSGTVDPIGGLKEKLLAAKKAGIKKVFIPSGNAPDVEEMEEKIKQGLEIIFVKKLEDIFVKYHNDIFLPAVKEESKKTLK